ncbi:unnamed protein product [Parascedosporium putredinis]|uniref:Uncharacterized protein n=1 Tax=Parascedosporium putredinis TaxID=1442378 RepID=A0A9P1HDW4_9PEZI|nr:unnamed protein product [Parascedosporium putredinis]CAI8005189.1 unnamed protein product [Parascedosporium putredinis]
MDHAVHHNIECVDGYDYSAANGRDASTVLGDIVKWYHDLRETPGGGEGSGNDWEHETVVELYRKHGWPGPNFDGDAFEVDHVRSIAHRALTWSANEPLRKLEESQREPNDWAHRAVEDALKKIKKAKKVDEEWMARWDLFEAEQVVANCEREAREARADAARYCPEGVVLRPEEELCWKRNTCNATMNISSKRAVTAVIAEAEKLYPGQTITTANGLRIMNESTKETRIEETNAVMESEHERMRHMQAWSEQIPKKAKKATAASQAAIKQCEQSIDSLVDMVDRINRFG